MSLPTDVNLSSILLDSQNVIQLRYNTELDKIKFLSYEEIISSNPAPMQFVLHPWLPTQGIAFIYAATGVGKTLFSLNVGYAIAAGGNFLKFKAQTARKVLYIDGEMAYTQIHSRFMQIVNQQGSLDFKDNWFLLTPEKATLDLPLMCQPEGQDFYNKKIDELGVEVIIFDNLSTLSAIDESNSEQWKIIQRWLINLRSRGKTVIIVHHSGKDKKGYRGTSRMLDCVDTAISLQDVEDNQSEADVQNVKKFKIEYQKNRSFGGKEAISFEVSLSIKGWEFESLEKTNTQRIIEMYLDLKMKPIDIATDLKVSRQYVYKIIKKSCL